MAAALPVHSAYVGVTRAGRSTCGSRGGTGRFVGGSWPDTADVQPSDVVVFPDLQGRMAMSGEMARAVRLVPPGSILEAPRMAS